MIRHATPADVSGIVALLAEHAQQETIYRDFPPDTVRAAVVFDALVLSPDAYVLISENKLGEITGVMAAIKTPMLFHAADQVQDMMFYVRPDARGQGVRLLREMERWGWNWDSVARVAVGTSSGDHRAAKFLHKAGYRSIGQNFEKVRS